MKLFTACLLVRPNPLNFTAIYRTDAIHKIKTNPVCALFAINIIFLWFGLLVHARRLTPHTERVDVKPLIDTSPRSEFFYRIIFYTGDRRFNGTTADVAFRVFGDLGVTEAHLVRAQENATRHEFKQNSVQSFVFGSPMKIGAVRGIRLWHNNQGESPCWYLHRVVVEDMSTGESHNFVVRRWLGNDKDIGTCDRIITKSPLIVERAFPFRYETKLMTLNRNNNLFFSMETCTAPEIRELTLYERGTLIAVYFALLSLFHAMFYGQKNVRYEAQIDYFTFNYSDLLVATQALAPTVTITCLIGILFRACKIERTEVKHLFLELPDIEDLRESRKRVLLNLLEVSHGVPMPSGYTEPDNEYDEVSNINEIDPESDEIDL